MALLLCDGFDSYSTATDLTQRWSSQANTTYSATSGRFGGGGVTVSGSAISTGILKNLGVERSTLYVAGSFKTVAQNSSLLRPLVSFLLGTAEQVSLALTGSGTQSGLGVCVSLSGVSQQVGTSGFTSGQWHRLEVWVTIADSTSGRMKVWIDGAVALDYTGDTRTQISGNVAANTIGIGGSGGTGNSVWDDIIIWDDQGSTFNSAPSLGDLKIETLRPAADASTQFSRYSGGTNTANVQDSAYDGDGSYVQSNTVGHKDLYDFGNLLSTPSSILGVVVNTTAKRTDTGSRTLASVIKSSSTESTATGVALTSTYSTIQSVHTTDPNTSSAWTETAVNALQGGFTITA